MEPIQGISEYERHLLRVCVERYEADMQAACARDQGNPDGNPGTVGNELQKNLRAMRERLAVR